MINANPQSLSNFNAPSRSHSPSPSSNARLEERDVKVSNGKERNLVNLLFKWDYENIGNGVIKYLFSKDIKALREVSTDMCLNLFRAQTINLSITPDRLGSMRPYVYQRLYPRAKDPNCGCSLTFEQLPADAIVKNADDLKKILEDKRFLIKRVVFEGKLEDLEKVRASLPESLRRNLMLPEVFNVIKEKKVPAPLVSSSKVVSSVSKSTNQSAQAVVDPNNVLFNSFIGVNKIPLGAIIIGKRVGVGGFGQVYRGSWGERTVALKKIGLEYRDGGLLQKLQWGEDLKWEIARLSTVEHPNIAQFYGIYQEKKEDYTYLVMEFCEGGDLYKKLKKQGEKIPWSKRWEWGLELSKGLAYLHSQGILHRDLKGNNVLLDHNDRVKLVDLGVAQVDDLIEETVSSSVIAGIHSLGYIAPENISDPTLSTKATDIYALGIVLWEIATNGGIPRSVWKSEDFSAEREAIPANCPENFKQLILECWHMDPSKRPSAEGLAVRLEALGAEFNPDHHALIKACNDLEKIIYPKRKQGLAYIPPFVTEHRVEEPIELYWSRVEACEQRGERAENSPVELKKTFKEFIKSRESSTLLLLGEAGVGKTITTYLWADELLSRWWAHINKGESAPEYFPLFIRAFVSNWTYKDIKGAFLNAVQEYNLPKDIPFLVIVDGYDELELDEKSLNLVNHIGLREIDNAKLIVTCRPNIVDPSKFRFKFTFKGKLETYHFLPFSVDQLLTYLKNELFCEEKLYDEYKRELKNTVNVRTVLRNPFILSLVKESWETVFSKKPLNRLSRYQIYEGFIENGLKICHSLLSKGVQKILEDGFENLLSSFEAFVGNIAFNAFKDKRTILEEEEALREVSSKWLRLKEYVEEDGKEAFKLRQNKLINIGNNEEKAKTARRALLKEEDYVQMMQRRYQQLESILPLKLRSGRYEFTHKSLYEYFLAKKLMQLNSLSIEEGISILIKRPIQEESGIIEFWKEGWEFLENKQLIELLFSIIKASRDKGNIEGASANAATLLAAIDVPFSGRNLRGIRIKGADLSGAILSNTCLYRADLQNTILNGAFLGDCDLGEANLEGVDFGAYPSIQCESSVSCLCYSKDNQFLAIGSGSKVIFYNKKNDIYEKVFDFDSSGRRVDSVAWSPDGSFLVIGGQDKIVRLLDTKNYELIGELTGHSNGVSSVSFSSDGKRLATGSHDKTIRIWDMENNRCIAELSGHKGIVNSVAFTPDGSKIVSGSDDTTIRVWCGWSYSLLKECKGHEKAVFSVAVSGDGKQMASGGGDNRVIVWESISNDIIAILEGHTGLVTSVTFCRDSRQLVSGSCDNTLRVWDAKTYMLVAEFKGHTKAVNNMAFSPNSNQLATASDDKTVKFWNIKENKIRLGKQNHAEAVTCVTFSPDGGQMVSGSKDSKVKLWDAKTHKLVADLVGHTNKINNISWSGDGKLIATASDDKTVKIWDASNYTVMQNIESGIVEGIIFNPNAKYLAIGCSDYKLRLWSVEARKFTTQLSGHTNLISTVAWSPDGKYLATGDRNNKVKLWDALRHQLIADLRHENVVSAVSFSPDSKLLASGSFDKTIRLWDVRTHQLVTEFRGHTASVFSLVFSPDGCQLASGGGDNMVKVWDIRGHYLVAKLAHNSSISGIKFSPNGNQLIVGSYDAAVFLWNKQKVDLEDKWVLIHRFENSSALIATNAYLKGTKLSKASLLVLKQHGANENLGTIVNKSLGESVNLSIPSSDNELFNQVVKEANDLKTQEIILLKFPDINIKDKRGLTILHYACMGGDEGLVKLLIKNFKASVYEGDVNNQTALHCAALKEENIKVLKTLIEGEADINAVDNNGYTSLMVAIKNNNIEAMSYLTKVEIDKYCSAANGKMIGCLERGNVDLFHNDFGGGLDNYSKALQEAERCRNNLALCFILIKLGDVYLNRQDNIKVEYYDSAAKFYSSAFSLTTQDSKVAQEFNLEYFIKKQYNVETKFIREQCKNKELVPIPSFIYYRTMLKVARENAASLLNRKESHIKNILIGLTTDLKKIVSSLFKESITMVGKAPCEYALLGLGSMSRNEMAPFSDVEIALVVSDSTQEIKTYFNNVLRLLQLKMISLGETEFKILDRGTTSIMPSGFSLDSGGNTPLGKEELIGTPEELARFQSMDKFGENIMLSNVLKTVCLIEGSGKLFETYQNCTEKKLSLLAPNENIFTGKKVRMKQALELMKGDTKEFSPEPNKQQGEMVFNLKKELYTLPSNFVTYLSLYHGIKAKSTFDRLEKLMENKIISKEVYKYLREIMEFGATLRIKTHLYYKQCKEYIFHKNAIGVNREGFYEMTDEEAQKLQEAYRILIPLHEAIAKFVRQGAS